MATKFLRGMIYNSGSTTVRASYMLKFMYEFWGFCIYGGASLSTPGTGAFAATTPFGGSLPANFNSYGTTIASGSNGASLPQATINVASTTNFPTSGSILVVTSGGSQTVTYTGTTGTTFTGCTGGTGTMSTGATVTTTSLLTFGADGYTNATTIFRMDGYTDFYSTSANFTAAMVGKQLVAWKSGSNSSEDSIYNIIAFKDANTLVINVNNGGTPGTIGQGYKPTLTTRSAINYRIIDVAIAATATGIADGNYIVFQMDPTGVNAGQATSQIQFLISGSTNLRLDAKMSPNGSWNGSAFGADASGTIVPNVGTSSQFFNGTTSGQTMHFNLIGDKSFLIGQSRDSGNSHGCGYQFHFEIPERLYPQASDLNPLILSLNGYNSTGGQQFHSTSGTYGYGGGFVMRCNDGVYRNYRLLAKASTGDGNATPNFSTLSNIANIFGNTLVDQRVAITPIFGSVMTSQAVLCLPSVAGQFSLARVRLRTIRMANTSLQQFTRFDSNGDFILTTMGIAITWDKTVLPLTIFPFT